MGGAAGETERSAPHALAKKMRSTLSEAAGYVDHNFAKLL